MTEAFVRQLLTLSCAQIAEQSGFNHVQRSALATLSGVVERYISELAFVAKQTTEAAGRTETNLLDLVSALKELQSGAGELGEFLDSSDELPFAKVIAPFPIRRAVLLPQVQEAEFVPKDGEGAQDEDGDEEMSSAASQGVNNTMHLPHVPKYLPAFPPRRTYKRTAVFTQRERDAKKLRQQQIEQNAKVEQSLISLYRAEEEASAQGDKDAHWGSAAAARIDG